MMNAQHAHRLFKAVVHHGDRFTAWIDQFVATGHIPSLMYLHATEDHVVVGLDAYDMFAVRFTRRQAVGLIQHVVTIGLDAFVSECARAAMSEPVRRNQPVAAVARSFNHRPSQLHRSKKTQRAKLATHKGRQQDARKAADFRSTCSTPYMTPKGKHRDPKPITIHTPRPIGANA